MTPLIKAPFPSLSFSLTVALFTLALLISCSINQPVFAVDEEEIDLQEKRIGRVKQAINEHREKLKASSSKEKELLDDLKKIDYRIFLESKKYVKLKEEIQEQEDLIKEQEDRLEQLKKEKEKLRSQVEKRLAAYYQMGDIGLINAVFSASSLVELLNFREMYEHMLRHDRQIFDSFRNKIRNITTIREVLKEERRKLEKAVPQAIEQQNILAEKRREREDLLEKVKTRKALYHNALAEMKASSRELRMTLADLKGETFSKDRAEQDGAGPIRDAKKRKPPSKTGFAGQKGRLIPPVTGKVIKKFHNVPADGEKFIFSEGINIRTEPGNEIKAVYKGKVIYAGMLPGYGKMIIIDHGNHYTSLVSGIAEFVREVGDTVGEGEIIATTSYHSGLLQDGIHFEVRYETEPMDPLTWIDRAKLENGL